MTPNEFRKRGHEMIEWLAAYQENVESYPVRSRVAPGEIRAALPAAAPQSGEPFDAMMADVESIIMPGVTHWQSPNFFAYFPANVSGPAILGELLAAGLGVNGMLWITSPAATELESHVLDWLVAMLDLPQRFLSTSSGGGVIQDSASSATLTAVIAARERATAFASRAGGVPSGLVGYASTQAHSSVEKAMMVAGLGSENLRLIDVDANFAMRPDALAAQIAADRAAGLTPFFVMATVGTTSSEAMDPLSAIGAIAEQEGIWFHVDGAMAGTAALCPEFRHFQAGIEKADSYCFNPHKWMFTNFDCDCFFVADRAALIGSLSVLPEYLRNQATGAGQVIDYRDWHVPLGRRFRALKLWFVIRHYGVEGLQHHIRQHVALTQEFAAWVQADPDFEIVAPVPLNLVCFRHVGGDAFNERLLAAVNDSGAAYLTHTKLNGQYVLRMVIGQTNTERRHVEAAWAALREHARALLQTS